MRNCAVLPTRRNPICAGLGLALLFAPPAGATYSIVAADAMGREVGGAVTSCVAPQSVDLVYRAAPGHGAIHAQAAANTAGRDRGVALLEAGSTPADVIAQITASSFDARFQTRQYGVVDLSGHAVGFTGSSAQQYREDRQGFIGPYVYSIQGNILTSARVLDQAEAAFKAKGCDLAERLMLALEAGAENGEGDSRCTTTRGIPSDAASLDVDREGRPAGSYLHLTFTSTSALHENPLVPLRAQFDDWRAAHACPTGNTSAGGATGGASAAGGNATGGVSASGGANAGASGGGATAASTDDGCGCRIHRRAAPWSLLAGAAAGLWLARRRRATC
jgi:uncharacterized Ntn-hydrolase superfamily protein